MIREFKDYKGNIKEYCDVCVIGSGAGGAVVAKEVAEQGHSVIVLEEGGYFTREMWNGKPAWGLANMYRNGGSTIALGNPGISLTLGKCIGGTTTVNSATCFRTPNHVLLKWQTELGLDNLTYDRLNPYFERVEKIINVTELSWDILGNSAKIVKRGADKLGLNCRPLKHNVKNCKGCGTCQFGCLDGVKQSMDVSYVPLAEKYGALFLAHCRADRLIIKEGEVRGVRGWAVDPASERDAYPVEIHAKVVVVSCGSLITPAFLKRNRLKNRNIGRHLQIHPAGRVAALMKEKIEGWKGVSQGVYIDNFENEGIILEGIFVHPGLLLSALPGIGKEHKDLASRFSQLAAFGVMIHDSTTGRVFRGRGRNGFLATYFIKKIDVEKFKRGIAYTARIFFAAGAEKVFTPIASMPVLHSMEDAEKLIGQRVKPNHIELMAFHPLGTCRMASSSRDGVVDRNGETFEVKNLYVADGSIVPTSLGVNPQETIMTLSTLVAEQISARLFDKKHLP